MKKFTPLLFVFLLSFGLTDLKAQSGYDIKINYKGCKDTIAYLLRYTFDLNERVDTCKKIVKGTIVFKGKKDLTKGMYMLVNQDMAFIFNFFVNENQKFVIDYDPIEFQKTKITGSKENEDYFTYLKFMVGMNQELDANKAKTKEMSKQDSAKFMAEKYTTLTAKVMKNDSDFVKKTRGTLMGVWQDLKTEKYAPMPLPVASNGRPDSAYAYRYWKSHFFDGVDFKDDRIVHVTGFSDRVKKYFDNVVFPDPDSVCVEIDKILSQTNPNGEMFKFLLAYLMPKYENHKAVGFDKVFVHMIDKYVRTGMAKDVYPESAVKKIIERGDILKPLLLGNVAPELYVIDTINGKTVQKMGFDTAKTSRGITTLYYNNIAKLQPLFKTLSGVQAKWTILVFWDVDCGHCATEIPKLVETVHQMQKKYDVKVMAYYTNTEFDKWRKFIIDKKLDFINVYDPIHLNNHKEKFDIYSTPVIFILDKDKKIRSKRIPQEKIPEIIEIFEKIEKSKK